MFGFRNQRQSARTAEVVQSRLDSLARRSEHRASAVEPSDDGAISSESASEYDELLQEAG